MYAVFKRNFLGYFLNPTGYVFICVFVLLSSIAAFVPDNFVNSNLANLAQLNLWFPLIALFFAPAISMNLWADERRLNTDELLLTQPISTLQIILGKYFAAVLVYTVSLLFSAIANYAILDFLGSPDRGLFATTYLGYWFVGVSTTALASIMSYATSQLTTSYILGALINVPLIALKWADITPISNRVAMALKSFSIDAFFEPFGRGVITLSSVLYFVSISVLALYVCLILLNRNVWTSTRFYTRLAHNLFRVAALATLLTSLVGFTRNHDLRADRTEEKLSALSSETIRLIEENTSSYPIIVEARLSANVPSEYVQTKLNIISILNEIKNRSKTPIFLDIREILPNTPEAYRLERQYDIKPRKVVFDSRGQLREDSVFMSIIFHCGSKTVTIPFLNRGLSVEYELISSLVSVVSPPKKRIGIVRTDAGAMGRLDMYGREIQKEWPLVSELRKRYIVESVDAKEEIDTERYDALVAVQPSSLTPVELLNFAKALRQGAPAVIFEDPCPIFLSFLPGTLEKRQPTPLNPVPPLKGEINMLWTALGVRFNGANVLWKNYNPYPKLAGLSQEYLFVDARPISYKEAKGEKKSDAASERPVFNQQDAAVAHLEHVLFPFVGCMEATEGAETTFTPLVQVDAGGYSAVDDILADGVRSQSANRIERHEVYTLAGRVSGTVPLGLQITPEHSSENPRGASVRNQPPQFNVVVIADVDMATPGFFTLREMGMDARSGVTFDFDNISFIMNVIDDLAQENLLISIRNRRPKHRTLERIEEKTREIRDRATATEIAYMQELQKESQKEQKALQKRLQELSSSGGLSRNESMEMQSALMAAQQRLDSKLDEKRRLVNHKIEEEQREVDEFVRQTQSRYKSYAVVLPPIPPLLIGLCVYIRRRRLQGSAYGM